MRQGHEVQAGVERWWVADCASRAVAGCSRRACCGGISCWPAADMPLPPPPLCSATAEGFDATFGKPREQLVVLERRRPARLVTGEGKLLPLVRGGSTKQVRAGVGRAARGGWFHAGIGRAVLHAQLLCPVLPSPAARAASVKPAALPTHVLPSSPPSCPPAPPHLPVTD